jgi:predicted MFS family arabinose efflux permease
MLGDLMGWLPSGWVLAAVAIPFAFAWMLRNLADEERKNDREPAPEPHQMRWDIRHIRHDTMLIAVLLMAILMVLIVIAERLPART